MQGRDALYEFRLHPDDVLDLLSGNRLGVEGDEVARMARPHRHTDLARLLETADAWAVTSAGIDDDEGTLGRVDFHAVLREDAQERIIDGALEGASVQDRLVVEDQDRWFSFAMMFERDVAALAHHVPEQNGSLAGVDPIVHRPAADSQFRAHLFGPGR